ncbi:CapA family protein [Hominisplanchenecus murintestinalis]|uniref:CapA family protein n=2 Tax=Hominisplanchenecus murintestinalis TaxID=2941517 RepID=A0AC61R115_9FIRM|nr:CapA family protein [Hominisplanchenecus murintestinalis]
MKKLIQAHRQKKRKRNIMIFCLLCGALLTAGTALYLTRASWLPSSAPEEAAAVPQALETDVSSPQAASAARLRNLNTQITISLVGDCTLGTDEAFAYDTSLNAYQLYRGSDYFLQNVKTIFAEDDLTIINMEGPLTESTERNGEKFAFKGAPGFVDILSGSSVEAANLANNHSHDYGEQGFEDTKRILSDAGITAFGYDETALITIKGIKIGLVGIYELHDHLERARQLKDNIAKVKQEGADLIITIFHWGNERETIPDSNQMALGHIAIDYGADLVAGHHPHVLQGIEEYRGKYIVYSLGNFCFGGNSAPDDMDTMIFQQTFTIQSGEVLTDENITLIPCSISSETGFNNYQPTPAEGSEAERILQKIDERSAQINAE